MLARQSLEQKDVSCMNEADAVVSKPEPQRASLFEAVERPLPFSCAEGGSHRVRGGEPGVADRRQTFAPPALEPVCEDGGEPVGHLGRRRRRAGQRGDAGHRTVETMRMMGKVRAEADHHGIAGSFEQDAGELGPCAVLRRRPEPRLDPGFRRGGDQVVRPLDLDPGNEGAKDLVQSHCGDQRERGRRRIGGTQAHQSADVEVAGRREPGAALAALAAGLPVGAQPQAIRDAASGAGEQIVVGGAGLGDALDGGQWALGLAKVGAWRSDWSGWIDAAASLEIASR